MTTKINYQALREIAKQATQGEWRAFISPDTGTYAVHTPGDERCGDIIKWPGFDGQKNAENNAEFIAAFNPKLVQTLLDERERNQQYIKRRDQENEDIALTVGKLRVELEAAKQRIAEYESNCGAMVAECQSKKAALEAILSHCPINHPDIDIACIANIAHNELGGAKSTTSKAYLVEIQAQGVEAFALTMRDTGDDPFFDSVASACADAADRFAAQLRKGGNQ